MASKPVIAVRIPEPHRAALVAEGIRRQLSVSEVIEDLLSRFLPLYVSNGLQTAIAMHCEREAERERRGEST